MTSHSFFSNVVHTACLWGILIGLLFFTACERPDEMLEQNPRPLTFSEDAIVFDTVFTALPTLTQYFHVYNPNKKAVRIQSARLGDSQSPYEVIIGGRPLSRFQGMELRGGDSLLVLVKMTIPPRDSVHPFILYDSLTFEMPTASPNIKLLTWGQDVHIVRKQQLACDQTWEAGKPYLLFDTVQVAAGCKLTIQPGARIYAYTGASLVVYGTLQAQGTAEKPILFSGFRQDGAYRTASGLWSGLAFRKPSQSNLLEFVQIRNATNAVFVDTPDANTQADVQIHQTIIQYARQGGILGVGSDIEATNVRITHCGEFHFAGLGGGTYRVWHATIVGEPYLIQRENPALVFSDYININGIDRVADVEVEVKNSVATGVLNNEVGLIHNTNKRFVSVFSKNLFKTTPNPFYYDASNLIEVDPKFADQTRLDYSPSAGSPLVNAGLLLGVSRDLNGKQRDAVPDIGAYER